MWAGVRGSVSACSIVNMTNAEERFTISVQNLKKICFYPSNGRHAIRCEVTRLKSQVVRLGAWGFQRWNFPEAPVFNS